MKTNSLGWKIFGLIFSLFLIWGGLSGEMALRGTHSSTALVVVGCLFLIWDIYALATHKKNRQIINKPAWLKSAGIMLIVASGIAIITNVMLQIRFSELPFSTLLLQFVLPLVTLVFFLVSGILFLSDTANDTTDGKTRVAFILLMTSAAISFILGIFYFVDYISQFERYGWKIVILEGIISLLGLALILFTSAALFIRKNKSVIRIAAILVIVFASIILLLRIYDFAISEGFVLQDLAITLPNLLSSILIPAAFIALAIAFYPRKNHPVVLESSANTTPKNETASTENEAVAGIAESQKQPKLRSLGKEVKGQYTYEYYAASSAEEAKQFLASREVTQSFYYIQVETPAEGVWGLDKDGLYLVNLLPFQTNLSLAQCEGSYTQFPFSAIVMASKGITDNFVSNIVCGSCGHEWKDALRVKSKTIVKCPKCKKYNSVDTNNINVL